MRTIHSIPGNLTITPSNSGCILQLERNIEDLHQLEKQFASYIYEPTTYSLFTKSQRIRESLSSLKKSNAELMATLSREKDLKIELFEKTMLQIRSFVDIQKSFDDYCRKIRY
ncbi:hypothetical protein [Arenibacter certesii]|uniref:Uncharacterized protein n=1 Tax=Arenibacter certesii TaxID=228955 RepID=A0A918J2J6_9FLAO|nr:hypothetical protein [Arenibacter certesii]GGW44489.1 hypothetical protein GCM10007383_31180 [Arenibacter certesii]